MIDQVNIHIGKRQMLSIHDTPDAAGYSVTLQEFEVRDDKWQWISKDTLPIVIDSVDGKIILGLSNVFSGEIEIQRTAFSWTRITVAESRLQAKIIRAEAG